MQIGTLNAGAGVATVLAGRAQCDQYLVIGGVGTANPLEGLTVTINGTPFIDINSAALITAFGKWQGESNNGPIGFCIKTGTGSIARNTTYRLQNAGATTPNIFAFSEAGNGVPFEATTITINPSSKQEFNKFSALFLETPANITSAEILFMDGSKDTLTPTELAAWFNVYNQTDANGLLGTVTVIDNTEARIKSLTLTTNNGAGGCTVLTAKLPDAAYKILKGGA